jgi:ADP-heptose:LPS heptosyltransferase
MFEGLRRTIGLQIARFTFRDTKENIVSFTDAVSGAHQVLLIMPFNHFEFLPTVRVIETMKKRIREEHITVITDELGVEAVRLLPRSQFIRVVVSDLNTFFLPHPSIIRRVKEKAYDLAVDLNLDLVLPSAYICKASNARVRIGFARKRAEEFYNFQIQPDLTLGKQLIYDRLAQCLQMF